MQPAVDGTRDGSLTVSVRPATPSHSLVENPSERNTSINGQACACVLYQDWLEGHPFTAGFKYATPILIALFLAAAALSRALPQAALGEEELAEI